MDIPLTYFKKRIQIVDEMFIRQHAVTIKTNLFNLLISLMLKSWGKYANIFCHFQVS